MTYNLYTIGKLTQFSYLSFVGAWKCAHIMTYIACEDQRLCDLFSFTAAHGVAGKTWSCISSRSSFISPWIALIFWTCWMLYIMKTLPGFQYDWCCLILVIVAGNHTKNDLVLILPWTYSTDGSRHYDPRSSQDQDFYDNIGRGTRDPIFHW